MVVFSSYFLDEILLPLQTGSLVVDLLDSDSIVSSGLDFEIVYQGPGLLNLNFKPTLEGIWELNVTPNTVYSTEISGYCTFNFLAKFYRLDWNSTQPSLAQIQGQPIASKVTKTEYYGKEAT